MEEVFEKLDRIQQMIRDSSLVQDLLYWKRQVLEDEALKRQIDQFHLDETNDSLKYQIYQNEKFKTYKQLENELFYFIMELNLHLKNLTEEKSCHL